MTPIDYRELLLQLCASLTLADHMGDVSNYVYYALKKAGIDVAEAEWEELGRFLGKQGITTLYGTSMCEEG